MIRVTVTVEAVFDDPTHPDTRPERLRQIREAIGASLKDGSGYIRYRIEGTADHVRGQR